MVGVGSRSMSGDLILGIARRERHSLKEKGIGGFIFQKNSGDGIVIGEVQEILR